MVERGKKNGGQNNNKRRNGVGKKKGRKERSIITICKYVKDVKNMGASDVDIKYASVSIMTCFALV